MARLDAAILVVAVFASSLSGPRAHAEPSRWNYHVGVGAGTMVSSDQRGRMDLNGAALSTNAHAGYSVLPALQLESRMSTAYFLAGDSANAGTLNFGGGVRAVFGTGLGWLRLQSSAHLNCAWTGALLLPSVDFGLALAFSLNDDMWFGPELTYEQVFWPDESQYSTDARFVIAGLFLAWRPNPSDEREAPQRVIHVRHVVHDYTQERIHERVQAPPPANSAELDRLLDASLPVTHREQVYLIPPVLFAYGSSELLASGEIALHAARDLIAESSLVVTIQGHADGRGDDAYNKRLSFARAARVQDWLVSHGIDATRLSIEAFGETQHLDAEVDDRSRQLSRRVTFRSERVEEAVPSDEGEGP